MKPAGERAHLRNIHLHLLVVDDLNHGPIAVGTRGQWNIDFLVDLVRPRTMCWRMPYSPSWTLAASSRSSPRKWSSLAFVRALCIRQPLFQLLILPLKLLNLSVCQSQ
jgi:hypothetical protein